jgi:hypothetical protein
MSGEPELGFASVFNKPNLLRSPTNPFCPVSEKANEYPHKYYWNVMTDPTPYTPTSLTRQIFVVRGQSRGIRDRVS